MIPFVDCQGLAGAWTLGTSQTGQFELIHRASYAGGFGDATVERNRALISGSWEQDPGENWEEWEPQDCGLLCGTPPCSGFSSLNTSATRGPGAAVNRCMWNLVNYAGHCYGTDGKRGPEVVAFESVQAAFAKGRDLMVALWERLEDLTDQRYELHHVLMSGASVGAAQMRHRYFWVCARIPFGVDPPTKDLLPDGRVVTYRDAISDLQGLKLQWDEQPYAEDWRVSPSKYALSLRREDGLVDAHMISGGTVPAAAREAAERGWRSGTFLSEAFDDLDFHPDRFKHVRDFKDDGLRRGTSSYRGLNWPYRVKPDQPGYVLAGSAARDFVHWAEPRLLTIREVSRLMGYPDAWRWAYRVTTSSAEIGKCCPVPSGRWISDQIAAAILGRPGASGRMIEEDEYVHNSTSVYKEWLD